jgi:tRNA threonylcarbamoyladenosine biosynthesis protein TsaE
VTTSSFTSHSEEETLRFAADFAGSLTGNEKISLIGPLGSGKTTFVRGFVRGRGLSSNEVASPTFTLIREYGTANKIYHVDLYRLEKEDDIFEAGIFDVLFGDDLVLVEWADHLKRFYPPASIRIEFAHAGLTDRIITYPSSNQAKHAKY